MEKDTMKLRSITILLLVVTIFFSMGISAFAVSPVEDSIKAINYSDISITISNISNTAGTTGPITNNTKSLAGKRVNSLYSMIKLSDLAYLGASTFIQSGNYYVVINGQTIIFSTSNASYSSSLYYYINNPNLSESNSGINTYTFSVSGNTEGVASARSINGVPYVRLKDAVLQCGSLFVNFGTNEISPTVFNFRVNGTGSSAYYDPNHYIV
ncbi:MAG: hypothetical protein IKR93_02620 [Firmicutes bacterium]|nr:hypothetical protein [Bacillota bacterium]